MGWIRIVVRVRLPYRANLKVGVRFRVEAEVAFGYSFMNMLRFGLG